MDADTVERAPARAAADTAPAAAPGGSVARVWELARAWPFAFWWGVSLALAVLSALVWPTVPSYDPFSWVVWGREVTDPHISFFVGGGPSWKPLPFLFTTIYGPLGGIAPALWVITARTGGIAGLIGAFRLAALLCERAGLRRSAWWLAGLVAALGIVLSSPASGWTYYFFRGTSEPLLIGVWLWAIDRLIAGRHWQAYALLAAEGLMRPEAWPFLIVYGAWLFWKFPNMRVWVVLGLVAQPVGWFVPPWISTGQPLLAATHAQDYHGGLAAAFGPRLSGVLGRGLGLQPPPSVGFAVAAVALALWRGRDRLVLWLAGSVVAWWFIVVGMTIDGYPGLQRFFLPAAAVTCVLSGLGIVRLAAIVAEVFPARLRVSAAAGGCVVLLAASVPFVTSGKPSRISYARAQEPLAATAVTRIDQLGTAIAALGGRSAILPCGSSVVTINHSLQTALAWKLGTTLERVQTVLGKPGIAFVGPHDSIDGGPPPIAFKFTAHELRQVGVWKLYQVYPISTRAAACVGS